MKIGLSHTTYKTVKVISLNMFGYTDGTTLCMAYHLSCVVTMMSSFPLELQSDQGLAINRPKETKDTKSHPPTHTRTNDWRNFCAKINQPSGESIKTKSHIGISSSHTHTHTNKDRENDIHRCVLASHHLIACLCLSLPVSLCFFLCVSVTLPIALLVVDCHKHTHTHTHTSNGSTDVLLSSLTQPAMRPICCLANLLLLLRFSILFGFVLSDNPTTPRNQHRPGPAKALPLTGSAVKIPSSLPTRSVVSTQSSVTRTKSTRIPSSLASIMSSSSTPLQGGDQSTPSVPPKESALTRLRKTVIPLYNREEATKFILIGMIQFFIITALVLSRDTKDTMVVTQCGAEAIAFLKV